MCVWLPFLYSVYSLQSLTSISSVPAVRNSSSCASKPDSRTIGRSLKGGGRTISQKGEAKANGWGGVCKKKQKNTKLHTSLKPFRKLFICSTPPLCILHLNIRSTYCVLFCSVTGVSRPPGINSCVMSCPKVSSSTVKVRSKGSGSFCCIQRRLL